MGHGPSVQIDVQFRHPADCLEDSRSAPGRAQVTKWRHSPMHMLPLVRIQCIPRPSSKHTLAWLVVKPASLTCAVANQVSRPVPNLALFSLDSRHIPSAKLNKIKWSLQSTSMVTVIFLIVAALWATLGKFVKLHYAVPNDRAV